MYVKLDDVLGILKTRRLNTRSIEVSDNIQQCINQIKKLPVEDSVPTVRGEWIMHTNFDGYLNHYECSVCHQAQGHKSRYCEECGSNMREQLTFYTIDWDILHKNGSNVLKIQLAKPLSKEWEELIIPRMKAFFTKKIYEYMNPDADIISITLCDRKGNVVKEY